MAEAPPDSADDSPIKSDDELLEVFRGAEKPEDAFRIGAEGEKFGVDAVTGAPLAVVAPALVIMFGRRPAPALEPAR